MKMLHPHADRNNHPEAVPTTNSRDRSARKKPRRHRLNHHHGDDTCLAQHPPADSSAELAALPEGEWNRMAVQKSGKTSGTRSRWNTWSLRIAGMLLLTWIPTTAAQQSPLLHKEQFVPSDQLDTVFDRDQRGVMMKRDQFKTLLEKARQNLTSQEIPLPIIADQANLTVTPGEQQVRIRMELKARQYAEGWQLLRIRAGNLLVEKVEVDGEAAVIARDPADPTALLLAHESVGEFTVIATMSTQLVTLGSDDSAAFELPILPAVELTVQCPAGRHLLVNDLKIERPAADDAVANYVIPVGSAPDVRLRWISQRQETEAQTLVFVRTDAQLKVQKQTLRWDSDSRISVFGGSINKVVARVPSELEITSVESTGLESWSLEDDPDNAGQTRVTMSWRQPFTSDRLIKVRAVAASAVAPTLKTAGDQNADGDGAGDDGAAATNSRVMHRIPTLQFAEVTAHSGRLVVTHEEGLRLVSETGSGVRAVSAAELGLSTDVSVFDFWKQQFDLKVAARPRDRELFAESNDTLIINDTSATFQSQLTIEALNAPLFELTLTLPADWQLTGVSLYEIPDRKSGISTTVTWSGGSEPNEILVKPSQPIAAGNLLPLVITLNRTLGDPDVEQKLALPVVTVAETTTVGGLYRIQFSDDLVVSPTSLTGLTPVTGTGSEQVFQNPGTSVSGELSITRRPARLAARSVLRSWVDSRHRSLDAEIITDVLSGTIRTLTIRLSESLGEDIRFEVRSVGPVPGIPQTRAIQPVRIIEQSAGLPADGLRPFELKLDHRFSGSLSLHLFVQQPRTENTPIAAPIAQVQEAVRQHGVLVFEASPDQQLSVGPDVRSIPGLFAADAGLVDPPDASTGRRVALTYRFVQPGYSFSVNATHFVTTAVPSAVCETLANVCTLNDSGGIQRWCEAKIQASGVQTLRFTLPGGEDESFLWSTMLNGEPVEVRRDAGDYLVAVPANSESQQHVLTVLFESAAQKSGTFGQTDHGPVSLAIDAGKQRAIPIDVLSQTWRVHYPPSSLLVESDGQFRPASGVDQPGWLVSLGEVVWPELHELPHRLMPLALFFLTLFVLTMMVIRRRWKTLAALVIVGTGLIMLTLSTAFWGRSSLREVSQAMPGFRSPASTFSSDDIADFDRAPMSQTMDEFGEMGMGGVGGAGGYIPEPSAMGGSMPGMPNSAPDRSSPSGLVRKSELASPPEEKRRLDRPAPSNTADVSDPFAVPESAPQPAAEPQAIGHSPENGIVNPNVYSNLGPDRVSGNGMALAKKRGSARLSVNVNLDVPQDYRSRQFVSVADAVHQPSMLSLVVQRRSQIAAIRLLAAMIIILLSWRIRNAATLWKFTVAVSLLIGAVAVAPLLSNAWQSVLDGIAIGSLISIGMTAATGCCRVCSCPLTWFRRQTTSPM